MIGPANIEVSAKPIASIGEQNEVPVELGWFGVGDCEEKGIDEACGGMSEEENMTDEEWAAHEIELEEEWIKPTPTIEEKWDQVEMILIDIHAMYIEKAEMEFKERVSRTMAGGLHE